ncbi:hypothetical protein [Sphingobacterium allocomposti]|uniref:hypothetical protein n=1 Tax=Sphingobacterium allocomposti TaxID=415956 RepID=UPI0011E6E54A|nr:hypothetical protein [Sphingobacterium composti Yoo et al. 2007 non Ten et al. 2007]
MVLRQVYSLTTAKIVLQYENLPDVSHFRSVPNVPTTFMYADHTPPEPTTGGLYGTISSSMCRALDSIHYVVFYRKFYSSDQKKASASRALA